MQGPISQRKPLSSTAESLTHEMASKIGKAEILIKVTLTLWNHRGDSMNWIEPHVQIESAPPFGVRPLHGMARTDLHREHGDDRDKVERRLVARDSVALDAFDRRDRLAEHRLGSGVLRDVRERLGQDRDKDGQDD